MDDELCDTVVMRAVQLQATFSVPQSARLSSKGVRTRHDGAHLSKGCTRGTTGLLCVLPLLRVLRFTTIAVLPHSEHNLHSTPFNNLYDAL
jgi:hypothetical protein